MNIDPIAQCVVLAGTHGTALDYQPRPAGSLVAIIELGVRSPTGLVIIRILPPRAVLLFIIIIIIIIFN